jgi:hypothetical protein
MLTRLAAILTFSAATAAVGCTDNTAEDFLGSWTYSSGEFRIDCGPQQMVFPADSTLIETLVAGEATDLSKSDTAGCLGITFDVAGRVASLSPSPQACQIPGMGTSTADTYTLTLSSDGKTLTAASTGTFLAPGAPAPCTFTGGGTLTKQ